MKLRNGYWWGDYGNRYDADIFSEGEAGLMAATLRDCSACLNCRDCRNCHGVENGIGCADIEEVRDDSNPFLD